MMNDVVRSFATDIEVHRAAICGLRKCTRGLIAVDILLCAVILLIGAELYLIERDINAKGMKNRDKE